jgi:hypothetical protein
VIGLTWERLLTGLRQFGAAPLHGSAINSMPETMPGSSMRPIRWSPSGRPASFHLLFIGFSHVVNN